MPPRALALWRFSLPNEVKLVEAVQQTFPFAADPAGVQYGDNSKLESLL